MLMATTLNELADATESTISIGPILHPWWIALLVAGGRECWAHTWFRRRHIVSYVPVVATKTRTRGKHHRLFFHPITPGMIFVPAEFTMLARRSEIEVYAHVYGYLKAGGRVSRISKSDIDIIREIEGKLSLPPPPDAVVALPSIGDHVHFRDSLYAERLGTGIVFQVASGGRIGVEVERLVGRAGRIFVPASEIEVM